MCGSQAWGGVLSDSTATKVEAAAGLSAVMHVKDATELDNTRRAANLSAAVLKVRFVLLLDSSLFRRTAIALSAGVAAEQPSFAAGMRAPTGLPGAAD